MIVHFIENLLFRIRERQEHYANHISSGAIANMEEYKLNVGKNRGLIESEEIIKKLFKEMTDVNTNEEPNDEDRTRD